MPEFRDFFNGLDWSFLTNAVISMIPALICITIHEMCHALAAYVMGDKTARTQGRLSLNPIRHIDPVGLLMLACFGFGWAKPVSVDMRNFKNPKRGMALTAFAGPLSNMLLACVILFIRGLLTRTLLAEGWGRTVLELLDRTAFLSIGLGIFNLIPIPPLDGSKILFSLLPDRIYMQLMMYERYGMILLVIIMFTGYVNGPLSRAAVSVFDVLFNCAVAGFNLVKLFL